MKLRLLKIKNGQSGQTLIETVAAIMILSTALTAGLGLAIYALNSSAVSNDRVIAINLAREGIDVSRHLRDSNWLHAGSFEPPEPCADIGNRHCYPSAFTETNDFDLASNPDVDRNRFVFEPAARTWSIDRRNGIEHYGLCLQPDGTYLHNGGGVSCQPESAYFFRRIRFDTRTGTPPYNYSISDLDNAEVIIQSIVQWRGKNCPAIDPMNITNVPGNCKIVVEERLTNWKDYR
jgi:type II secretory pathway pseudopilin PulG